MKTLPIIRIKYNKKFYYPTLYTIDILNKYITFTYLGSSPIFVRNLKNVNYYIGIKDSFGKKIYEGDTVVCKALSTTSTVIVEDKDDIPVAISDWPELYKHKEALKII